MALQPIPLTAESYQLASVPAAQHRLLNMIAEPLPDGARAKYWLKSTPGLVQAVTMGSGPIYKTATLGGTLFAISSNGAFSVQDNLGVVSIVLTLGSVGGLTSDFYHHSIAVGLVGPCFVCPPNAFMSNFAGAPLVQITTGAGNWPAAGVSSVCYLDGYYIFTSYSGDSFFVSDLLSPTTYSGLSFVRLSSEVDFVEHAQAFNRELWLFGQNTVSAWYNTGDPVTPFSPRSGGVIHKGCGSHRTICEIDGSLFFLGIDGVVYRTVGYQAKRVSNHALEELLSNYSGGYLRSVWACAFTHEGHSFYSLSMPAISRSFVYDCTTGMWAERCSQANGVGMWTITTASELGARWLLGDATNGNLYYMRSNTTTEKGVAIKREARLPVLATHGPRAFMSRLEVECEVGTAGPASTIALDWSDDGGATFTTPRNLSTGALGATRTRVATTRLGSFRQRVLRLAATGPMEIYGVDVDMGAGDS